MSTPYPVNIRKIRISQLMIQPLLYFVIIQNNIREREREKDKERERQRQREKDKERK